MAKKYLLICFCLMINSVCLFSCYKDSNFQASSLIPKTLFQVTVANEAVPADGYSKANITVTGLPVNTNDTNQVTFTTDYGTFISNNSNTSIVPWTYTYNSADSLERIAPILLQGTIVPDTANLSATVNGVTIIKNIYFVRAYPDQLNINTSSIFVSTSDSAGISVNVSMIRYYGISSLNTPLNLTITDNTGKSVGAFSKFQNLSDSSGNCSFQFSFVDTTYVGALLVKANVGNITNSISLQVVK